MKVIEGDDGHFVLVEQPEAEPVIIGPFATNAGAWQWIDGHGDEGRKDSDRHNRIRRAFAGEFLGDER